MNILILGAGRVGSSLAEQLSREESNDVTVVDIEKDVLRELQDRLDIRTISGHASHPSVLKRAGCEDADIVVALTDSDETNMLACQISSKMFNTETKIARIRSTAYLHTEDLFGEGSIPVDLCLSPEQLVCEHIEQLIHYPGALEVLEFANGEVRLVAATVSHEGLLVGQEISTLKEHIPNTEGRIAAIYRNGQPLQPEGDTVIRPDDEVFFIAAKKDIRTFMSEMKKIESPVRRVLIAGGGHIGVRLAAALENTNQVKIIERNPERAKIISERLDKAIVLVGDAADEELLTEEDIDSVDVFCALTNAEEANILSAMLAKSMGAKKVMALLNRPSYADLVEAGTIDIAISPKEITIGSLLAYVRGGDVVKVHSLRRGAAEAIETVVHGNKDSSSVVGKMIEEIDLPSGCNIVTIVRDQNVIITHHDTVIEENDHLILFVSDRNNITDLEKIFQKKPSNSKKHE
ncbi:MAG TPA: Trk system potassium transporter TrkA [Woeseiaceae bacterium]|nr:Trk system potassium transporter TrkA [Woeseiaceae bacterium]